MNGMEAGAAPWPAARVAWYSVFVLMFAYILSFIDRVIISLLVGPIRADLGISDTRISLLYGFAFAVFYTLLGIPIAWAADRFNRRNIIATGIALWSLMTAFCGVAKNLPQLALARIGVGVGEATLSPSTFSLVGDSFPEKTQARALSVYTIGLPLGVGLALVLGGQVVGFVNKAPAYDFWLLGTVKAWQVAFLLVGLPGLLVALWVMSLPEPARRHRVGSRSESSIATTLKTMVLEWRAYTAHILGFSTLGMVMNVFQLWGVQYFIRVHHFTVPQAGLTIGGAIGVLGTVGILSGGWLTDRWRARGMADATLRSGQVAALALVPFTATCTLVSSLPLAVVLLLPIGFFTSFAFGSAAAGVVSMAPPNMRAKAGAIYMLALNMLGIGLAPFLTARLTDAYFNNDLAVGKSCAIVATAAAIVAALLFTWGRPHFRSAVERQAGRLRV